MDQFMADDDIEETDTKVGHLNEWMSSHLKNSNSQMNQTNQINRFSFYRSSTLSTKSAKSPRTPITKSFQPEPTI